MISLSVFTISSLSKASEERANVTRGGFARRAVLSLGRATGTPLTALALSLQESPAYPTGAAKPRALLLCTILGSGLQESIPALYGCAEGLGLGTHLLWGSGPRRDCSSVSALSHQTDRALFARCSLPAAIVLVGDEGTVALEFPHQAWGQFKEPLL